MFQTLTPSVLRVNEISHPFDHLSLRREKYKKKINILSLPVDFSLSLCYNINIKRNKEVPNEVPDGFKKSHALNPHPPRRRFYLRYVPRWHRRLSAYVRWRRRPPLGWLRRLPRVHSSRSLHITRSSGLSRLRVLTAVKKERRCFPRSHTSRIFLLSPPIAPCFFYVYICYLLFLFLRTQLLDTPTVFFFFALLGRKTDADDGWQQRKKNRSLTWFGGGLIGHTPLASLPLVVKNFFVRKNLGLCKKNGGRVKKILGHRKNMGAGEKYGPMMSTIYSMVTIVKTQKGYFLHNQMPNGKMTITVIITSIACCNRSI